jgi:hypothetical protein
MMQLMALQTADDAAPPALSPLLTHEALRRVAWSVFFLDSTLDGGRHGSGLVDVTLYRIQLPCPEQSFLGNDRVHTGSILEPPSGATGLSALLMRAVLLRRRAFDILLGMRHGDADGADAALVALERSVAEVKDSVPPRYHFTEDNVYLHRQRLPAFLLFHLLVRKVRIIINTTKLALLKRAGADAPPVVAALRLERISRAITIARVFDEGLKHQVAWDMQATAHAYVAIESGSGPCTLTLVLLFEPRRLAELNAAEQGDPAEIEAGIAPLLAALREGSARSEIIRLLVRLPWPG